jgi:L-asparaginase II
MTYRPLVELTRGGIVESVHHGALAIADAQGRLIASVGEPGLVAYLRSSAKPFQAVPLIETGAADAYDLSPREIALVCASHKGMDMHAEAAASIQAKIGAGEGDLLCGTHEVGDPETAQRLIRQGLGPTANRHNCSGKHSGMLALARHHDWPLAGYVRPEHPAQQLILRTFAELCGLAPGEVVVGVDGCSAPNFAIPLVCAATAYARLADPASLAPRKGGAGGPAARAAGERPHRRANALRTLFFAMTAHPEMISGPGQFDTELMRRRPGQVVAKGGAEGYYGLGLAPGALQPDSPALGLALKVADGNGRAVPVAVLEVLRRLGFLDEDDLDVLAGHGFAPRQDLRNFRGLITGEARPAFELDFSGQA